MYIQANKISKNFNRIPLFENLNLKVNEQEKIGLIGQNGTGKTTLLQILMGLEGVNDGTVSKKKNLSIGYVSQKLVSEPISMFDYIYHSFCDIKELHEKLTYYEKTMATNPTNVDHIMKLYGNIQQQFEDRGGYQLENRIRIVLKGLGIYNQSQLHLNQLSGGERIRVELAKILIQENDLLLLDEPTNHLDLSSLQWLEEYLSLTKSSFIVISHDRTFLDHVTRKTIEIEDGQIIEYVGNYSSYVELKKSRITELKKNHDLQQREINRMKLMIRRYRQWGNEGGNEAYFKKAKEVERRLEKMTIINAPELPQKKLSKINQGKLSGKEIIVAKNITKSFDNRVLFKDSSFTIYRGERIAVLGKNGSGKSTFLKTIMGEINLDKGKIKISSNVSIGYLPQQLAFEKPKQSLLDYVKNFIPYEQAARQVMANFGFYAPDIKKRVDDLSGGEQVRIYLMKLFQKK